MIPYHLSDSDGRPYLRHRSPSGSCNQPNSVCRSRVHVQVNGVSSETRHPQAVTPGGTGATLRPGVCLGGARIRVPSVGKPGHTPGNVKLLLPPRQSRGNSQCIRATAITKPCGYSTAHVPATMFRNFTASTSVPTLVVFAVIASAAITGAAVAVVAAGATSGLFNALYNQRTGRVFGATHPANRARRPRLPIPAR